MCALVKLVGPETGLVLGFLCCEGFSDCDEGNWPIVLHSTKWQVRCAMCCVLCMCYGCFGDLTDSVFYHFLRGLRRPLGSWFQDVLLGNPRSGLSFGLAKRHVVVVIEPHSVGSRGLAV